MKRLKNQVKHILIRTVKPGNQLANLASGYKYTIIKTFQDQLYTILSNDSKLLKIKWLKEHKMSPDNHRDSIDIYGESVNFYGTLESIVIIEIDNTRADQVGKKIASRFAFASSTPCLYVAICYPGKHSNPQECKKYFQYGSSLLKRLNSRNEFLGVIIDQNMKPRFY